MEHKLKYDVIGSYLAPEYLASAREDYNNGNISFDELKRLQDKAFDEVVERQIEERLEYVTSGELRRAHWGRDFYTGLGGVSNEKITEGSILQDETLMTDMLRFKGRICYNPEHPFFETLTRLSETVNGRAKLKQTIPSPADLYRKIITMTLGSPEKIYGSPETLVDDISEAYNKTIRRFYELGCRQIQLDDTVAGRLSDPTYLDKIITNGLDPVKVFDDYISLINKSLADLPADLVKSIYISGGNPIIPEWNAEATPDNIMPQVLARLDVDIFYLPFDRNSLETLDVLKYVAPGKRVVLGLISAHDPLMENPEDVLAAVNYATRFIPMERLSISPMSGFKLRSYITRGLNFTDQWRKIDLLAEIASMA